MPPRRQSWRGGICRRRCSPSAPHSPHKAQGGPACGFDTSRGCCAIKNVAICAAWQSARWAFWHRCIHCAPCRAMGRTYQLSQVALHTPPSYSPATNEKREQGGEAASKGACFLKGGMRFSESAWLGQPEHRVGGNDDLLRDCSCYCMPVGPGRCRPIGKSGLHLPGLVEQMLRRMRNAAPRGSPQSISCLAPPTWPSPRPVAPPTAPLPCTAQAPPRSAQSPRRAARRRPRRRETHPSAPGWTA
jgi:hypothetical protein